MRGAGEFEDDDELGTIVFLLGAGCSLDCGIPVMGDFMDEVSNRKGKCHPTLRTYYENVIKFQQECRQLSYVFSREWKDIEQLYTQAQMYELKEFGKPSELSQSFLCVLWDICRSVQKAEFAGYDMFAGCLRILFRDWNAAIGPRPIVITTNYDVCLECALLHSKQSRSGSAIHYPGFNLTGDAFIGREDFLEFSPAEPWLSAFEIIKLHGSVNWFEPEPENPEVCTELKFGDEHSRTRLICQSDDPNTIKYENKKPLLIPPALQKLTSNPVIITQWRAAIRAVSKARQLVVMGYSFAETDTFMTRLIAEGIRESQALRKIVVVDPSQNQAWWDRVRAIFGQTWWEKSMVKYRADFRTAADRLGWNDGHYNRDYDIVGRLDKAHGDERSRLERIP